MWRLFRAMFYFCTGRLSKAADIMQGNEYVMAATYDAAIDKNQKTYQQLRDAVARMIGIEQDRLGKIKLLTKQFETLEAVKQGAIGKTKKLAAELQSQGVSAEDIKKHPEYVKHMAAYQDAASSAKDKETEIQQYEAEIKKFREDIAQYKVQLQKKQRNNDSLRQEKQEAAADMAIAKEIQSVNDLLNGVAEDTTDKDLQAAREARKFAKNKATISSELAGNDAKLAEDEYISFAANHDASNEFDALIGLEENVVGDLNPAKLPE